MKTIQERVLEKQREAEEFREKQRLEAEKEQQNQVTRSKQLVTTPQGQTTTRTIERGGQGQVVPGQEDLFASAQSGGRPTRIGSNVGDKFDAVTGEKISSGLVTQAQELEERIASGELNRFEQEQAKKDLEALQASIQFGAHTGAPTSYVDEVTGQTIRTELSGQEKLQKDRFMAAAEDARSQGVGFTSTSASGFGVPSTFADVQTTFTSPADSLKQGKKEDYNAFRARKAEQKVREVSEALSTAFQENNLKRVAELLKTRNDLQRPQLDESQEAKSKLKVLADREAKEAREEFKNLRDQKDRELQEERDSLINEEFNRRKPTLSVSSEGARSALEKQLKDQITSQYEKAYQDQKESLDAKYRSGEVTLDEEYAKTLQSIEDAPVKDQLTLERENLTNTLLDEGLVSSPNKAKSVTTALLAFDTEDRDDIIDSVRDGEYATIDAAIAVHKERQKISGGDFNVKEGFNQYSSLLKSGAVDINQSYGKAMEIAGGNSLDATKIMKMQGLPQKEIDLQRKDYNIDTLGYKDEQLTIDDFRTRVNNFVGGVYTEPGQVKQFIDDASEHYPDSWIANQLDVINKSIGTDPRVADVAGQWLGESRFKSGKTEGGDASLTFQQKIDIPALGRMLYGARISDKETERVQNIVLDPEARNLDRFGLIQRVLGFNVTENEELGEALMNQVLAVDTEEGLAGFDMIGLSKLLNTGNTAGAIRKVENFSNAMARKNEGDNFVNESFVASNIRKYNKVEDELEQFSSNLGLGVIGGSISNWLGRAKPSEQKKIRGMMSASVAQMRNELLGSAVTPAEEAFLEDVLPKATDDPIEIANKLDNLKDNALIELNSMREIYGMPSLTEDAILNKKEKEKLYLGVQEEDIDNGFSDLNIDPYPTDFLKALPTLLPSGFDTSDIDNEALEDFFQLYIEETPDVPFGPRQPQSLGTTGMTRPERNKNPGNIKVGGIGDQFAMKDAEGNPVVDDQNHLVFADAEAGFNAMKADIEAKVSGDPNRTRHASILGPNPTIADLNNVYAEDPNWKNNVASILGVDVNTPAQSIDIDLLVRAIARAEGGDHLISNA